MLPDNYQNFFLFAKDDDEFLKKVFAKDILYIETIKSSHYCIIKSIYEETRLKADIKALSNVLPDDFFRCRSSTIINLNHVKFIDLGNRLIYFEKNTFCSFSQSNKTYLKEKLHLFSYRCLGSKLIKN